MTLLFGLVFFYENIFLRLTHFSQFFSLHRETIVYYKIVEPIDDDNDSVCGMMI